MSTVIAKVAPTKTYSCGQCGGTDCKLWRPSHVFAEQIDLICWRCLEDQGHKIKYTESNGDDQVYNPELGGSLVPAVPDLEGNWWG